jgi:hypothetical protein
VDVVAVRPVGVVKKLAIERVCAEEGNSHVTEV